MVKIENKWIDADFVEVDQTAFNPTSGEKNIVLTARIVPFNKISRNKIMYNRKKIEQTCEQIKGLNLHHNHITDGSQTYPNGEWFEVWIQEDGLYGKAKVYNTSYNREYIEWLQNASCPKVSLQVTGDAQPRKGENGERYQEAFITNWKEISTVNIPGFIEANAQFAVMAEKLLSEQEDEENLEKQIIDLIDTKL